MTQTDDGLPAFLIEQPLLALAIAALLTWLVGWQLRNALPRGGALLQGLGYFLVAAALLLTIAEAVHRTTRSDAALALAKRPELAVRGGTTVVPVDTDGHYWVEARIGDHAEWFLIDTGATYTGLSKATAEAVGIAPDPSKLPIRLDTANGPIIARMATVPRLTFGNIEVRDLEVAISPIGDDDTNLVGMNLLSRLASYRVEGRKMILTPHQPERAVN